jgi:hypothetical protein
VKGGPAAVPGEHVGQFNPKFGIIWNPLSGTSIRAAVSRVVKRTLITDQTLEPTQVAGFNQFFDDADVTKSWRYGAAIDQKFSKDVFGGLEFSRRHLEIPAIDATVSPATIEKFDAKEYLGRAYVFWTPQPWVALRTEYVFERFENDPAIGAGAKLNSHSVPLGMNFFHPSGLSASLIGTYHYQDGRIVSLSTGSLEPVRGDFWTIDAAINYRLPKRYGFITVGATNLADRKFKFFDTDRNNPRIQPDRVAFFRLTLALP